MTKIDEGRLAILRVQPAVLESLLQLPRGAFIEGICTEDHMGVIQLRIRGAGWPVSLGGLIPTAEPPVMQTREAKPEDMIHAVDWKLP
jgi:hypothetical protein